MGHLFENLCVFSLVIFVLISTQIQVSLEDELIENTLSVTFSKVSQESWHSSGYETKFRIKIAFLINSFCPNNTRHCGLKFWNNTRKFTSDDVEIVGYIPRRDNLEVKFFNHLPEGSDIREDFKTVVPAPILKRILWQRKNEISYTVGVSVLSVGRNGGATDSDNTSVRLMNFTMIPISFTALIIVSLLAWCLHYCQKMKMRSLETERRKQLAMKNKSQQLDFTGAVSKHDNSADRGMQQQIYDNNNKKGSYADKDNPNNWNRGGKPHSYSQGEQEPKKKYKKKKKTCQGHEGDNETGHRNLEFHIQNHFVYQEGYPIPEAIVTNGNQEFPVCEGSKRKTKRKKRKNYNQSYVDRNVDEAGGSVTVHDNRQIRQLKETPRELPPVKPPRNQHYEMVQ